MIAQYMVVFAVDGTCDLCYNVIYQQKIRASKAREEEGLMFQVVKRDGEIAEFQMAKISSAISRAFDAKEKNYSKDMIDLLSLRVTADFQDKIQDDRVTVEDIQDSVENVLIQAGYSGCGKGVYSLPQAEGKDPKYEIHDSGLQRNSKQLCKGRGLARKREFYSDLFRRRSDLQQFRCSHCQLLAV